jgi:mRNA interferase RelE/StbE
MTKFEIIFKRSVKKDLRPIPTEDVQRILSRIASLSDNPRPLGAKKLTNQERYRIRQGVYRILYEIQQEKLVVTVVKIGHRRGVYKNS